VESQWRETAPVHMLDDTMTWVSGRNNGRRRGPRMLGAASTAGVSSGAAVMHVDTNQTQWPFFQRKLISRPNSCPRLWGGASKSARPRRAEEVLSL
jgi:hypothetical protein